MYQTFACRKPGHRVLTPLLGRSAAVLVFGVLLCLSTLAQAAPTTLEFNITEPGQSVTQVVSSSMSSLTDVSSVRLCVPQCANSTQETKPGGTLTLADGAIWAIEQRGSRRCLTDVSGGRTCTEEWNVKLVSPPGTPDTVVQKSYPGSVEITFSGEIRKSPENSFLRGLYNFTPELPAEITFEKASYGGNEGDLVDIVLLRSGNASQVAEQVIVTIDAYDPTGNVTEGNDYTLSSNTVTWNPGESGRKVITANLLIDEQSETSEDLELLIADINGFDAAGAQNFAILTIVDVPPPPVGTVQFDLSSAEVKEDAGTFTAELTRTGGSRNALSVRVNAIDGTAIAGKDFVKPANPEIVSWKDGEDGTKSVSIPIISDRISESTEQFSLALVPADLLPDSIVGNPASMDISIINVVPPAAGTVEFSAARFAAGENDGSVELTVVRKGGRAGTIDILLDTKDGTALSGADYTGTSASIPLSWKDQETGAKTAFIKILPDNETETNEVFSASLTGLSQMDAERLGSLTDAQITITDVPPLPKGTVQFASAAISVSETDATADVQVTRTGGSAGSLTVEVSTLEDSATDAADFTGINPPMTLTWADGDTASKTVKIKLLADALVESDELFVVELFDPNAITDSDSGPGSTILGSITDTKVTIKDVPPVPRGTVQFTVAKVQVQETAGKVELKVTRIGGTRGEIKASVSSRDGSAMDGADYNGLSAPLELRWADGEDNEKIVSIDILTDNLVEQTEDFEVIMTIDDSSLIKPQLDQADLGNIPSVTVEILDVAPPEPAGVIEFTSASIDVLETDSPVQVSVVRTGGTRGSMTALVRSVSGSAIDGEDFIGLAPPQQLVWLDGESDSKTVSVVIANDAVREETESFTLQLFEPQGLAASNPGRETSLGRALGSQDSIQVNILNVDPAPSGTVQFASATVSALETDGNAVLSVTRTGGSAGSITAFVTTKDGSANSGDDYTGLQAPLALTWADGDSAAKTVSIPVLTDTLVEQDENFTVSLGLDSESANGALGSITDATVTLVDVPPLLPGVIEFAADSADVRETDERVVVSVLRVGGTAGRVVADLSSIAGTATDGADYTGLASPQRLVWEDGDGTAKRVTIPILEDALSEPTETFTLRLTDPVPVESRPSTAAVSARAIGQTPSMTINIINVDKPRGTVQFADAAVKVLETDGSVSLALTRRGGTAGAISVLVGTLDGSAKAGADYTAITPPDAVTWADGDSTTKTVNIKVATDQLSEPDETFKAILSVAGEADASLLGSATEATVTINNVDPPARGTLQFTAAAVGTSETEGRVLLQISRQGGTAGSLSALVSTKDGSAVSGEDYVGLAEPLRLTWADGESASKNLNVAILADTLPEPDETFTVTLSEVDPGDSEGGSGFLGQPSVVTVTIMNIDPALPGSIAFAAEQLSVRETDGNVKLSITRTGGSDGRVSARVVTRDGTATDGKDYTGIANGQLVVWEDGDAKSKTVNIAITDDGVTEPLENFTAALSLPAVGEQASGASLGKVDTMRVDIVNVDPASRGVIEFAASTVSVQETDGKVRLLVNRNGGTAGAIRALVTTTDGSAIDGADYTAPASPIVLDWAAGDSTAKAVDIAVLADGVREETENFDVQISLPTETDPALLGTITRARVSITDVTVDKPGSVSFSAANQSVIETAGSVTAVLQRSGGADGAISVQVLSLDGTATASEDYTAIAPPVTVSWADGDTADKRVAVAVLGDTTPESKETFSLQLQAVGETVLGSISTQTVTIDDATQVGVLAFASATVATEEDAGSISLVVNRVGGSDGAVSVGYSTVADTAVVTEDFTAASGTLDWADGDAAPKTISIAINEDEITETAEQFNVVLSDAKPFGDETLLGSPSTAVVTIAANTEAPINAGVLAVAVTEIAVDEDAGTAQLSVTRGDASAGAISVDYTLVADSATAGDDFVAASGTLNWADGDNGDKVVGIEVLTDGIEEAIEQFSLVLSNAQAPANHLLEIGESTTRVSINDTTERGTLQLLQSTLIINEAEAVAVIQVERVDGADGELEAGFNIVGQTAEPGVDFTAPANALRWNNGESGVKELRIEITVDNVVEGDETFTLQLLVEDEPDTVNNNARNILVIIRDSPVTGRAAVDLVIVSGDNQVGEQGDTLEPLVLEAQNEAGVPVSEPTTIRWGVEPPGAAVLVNGPETQTNEEGQTSNQVSIVSNGFIRVVATVIKPNETAGTQNSRIDPEPLPLSQGQIAFTVRAGLQARPGLSRNQSATGAALDDACDAVGVDAVNDADRTPAQDDLLATCQQLQVSSRLAADLDRLGHEEYFAIADSVTYSAEVQLTNVYSRINALRSGRAENLDLNNLQLSLFDQTIPGSVINAAQNAVSKANDLENNASASNLFSRLGFFASGSISKGEVDGDGIEQDTDVSTTGVTIGADYRLSDSLVVGAGVGLVQNETDFAAEAGGADVDGVNLTLFGTWYQSDKGYVDVVLDIGQNSYDLERQLNIGGAERAIAKSDTDASVVAFNLGAGKNFQRGSWEFGPYARLSVINASVDGFSESVDSPASFGSALSVQSHDVNSLSVSIGGQLAKTVSTGFGVMVPQLRVEFESEDETRKDGITASFSADPESTPFTLEGRDRDSNFANIGLGTSVLFRNGKSGYVFYETRAAHDFVTQHWLKFGFRAEF